MASAQVQQVAACNALHELEERLSRWLLQTRDLLKSDTLPLTQEFLSQMLGVQRSSVTLVARKLQEAGLINYRRGHIHVLDVEALRESCANATRQSTGNSTGSPAGVPMLTTSPHGPPALDFSLNFSSFVGYPTEPNTSRDVRVYGGSHAPLLSAHQGWE
jgi:DNA-binding transcriptional MocR family regulator